MNGPEIQDTAAKLVRILTDKGLKISCAESCSGGLLAAAITDVAGASAVFPGSFVTYSINAKHKMTGVSSTVLRKKGAVSTKSARAMARGAAMKTGADIALSITGNAGPEPSEGKPIGLVYIGVYSPGRHFEKEYHFEGDRASIREQAVYAALQLALAESEDKE